MATSLLFQMRREDVYIALYRIDGSSKLDSIQIIEFPVVLLQWRRRPTLNRLNSSTSSSSLSTSTESTVNSTPPRSVYGKQDGLYKSFDTFKPSDEFELTIVDEYRRFVKPVWRPTLSQFCTELTGITQADVNSADSFVDVLYDFQRSFMIKYDLFSPTSKTTWVTDGPWVCYKSFSKT